MSTVNIGGVPVDIADPCALWQALYAEKLKILAGERVEEISLQSPVSREMMRVSSTNLEALEKELTKLAAACQLKQTGKRARYRALMRY